MSLSSDLREQAFQLAYNEPKRPRQASLRRAISAAYYSLFHLLTEEAGRTFVRGASRDYHRLYISRAMGHERMKEVASQVLNTRQPPQWLRDAGVAPSEELREVAERFVTLQALRATADYDTSARLTRQQAIEAVSLATEAASFWKAVRLSPEADLMLIVMLVRSRTTA